MKPSLLTTIGGLAFAGLFAIPAFTAQQERDKPGSRSPTTKQDRTRLDTEFPSMVSFRVRRDSEVPGSAAAKRYTTSELRFDLRKESSLDIAARQAGHTTLLLEVSSPAMPGDDRLGQAPERRTVPARPAWANTASYRLMVDDAGRIVRMETLGAEKTDPKTDPNTNELTGPLASFDEKHLKCDLAIILGTGLQQLPLEKGMTYHVTPAYVESKPAEAAAKKPAGVEEYVLKFEAVQAAIPALGAADKEAKEAAFLVLSAEHDAPPGHAAGQAPGKLSAEATLGRATYSLADGLVTRFEVRPQATPMEPKEIPRKADKGPSENTSKLVSHERLTIERVSR